MTEALIYFGASTAVLLVLSSLYIVEDIRGKRIVLANLRDGLDGLIMRVSTKLGIPTMVFEGGFVRLIIHYVAHTVLGGLLRFLRRIEQRVESIVHRNRNAAKQITRDKQARTHLDEIADHKHEVALSEKEKERLKQQ